MCVTRIGPNAYGVAFLKEVKFCEIRVFKHTFGVLTNFALIEEGVNTVAL